MSSPAVAVVSSSTVAVVSSSTVVVAVDVGKTTFAMSVTDTSRTRLFGPVDFAMTAPGLADALVCVRGALPAADTAVRVGVEAAGHYHRPLVAPSAWPAGWLVLELNPAHVGEQRRVQGRRRVKTDAIDLDAITELVLSGRGYPVAGRAEVIGQLTAWSAHRTLRVAVRTATKNQLLGQLDRSFPGLTLALPDVLGTKVGRLVAEHFADPRRLATLGATRFIRFASARGLQVRRTVADRLVVAARDALPMPDAAVARQVLAADLVLLANLDAQVEAAEAQLTMLLPGSPFATLTTTRAGGPSGPETTAPPSVTRPAGQATGSSSDLGPIPGPVRVRRPTPRRLHQPRRQRRAAPRPDRPRDRTRGRANLPRRPTRQP